MDIKTKNILVVGLGSMGFGIAQSLIRAGYSVYGQDKNPVSYTHLTLPTILLV